MDVYGRGWNWGTFIKVMEEIRTLILKEKLKEQPNKEYIQFLQQLMDKKEMANHVIAELKEKNYLKKLHQQNYIEMEDWFRYSGKTEDYTNIIDKVVWKNNMADRLIDYMNEKKLRNER